MFVQQNQNFFWLTNNEQNCTGRTELYWQNRTVLAEQNCTCRTELYWQNRTVLAEQNCTGRTELYWQNRTVLAEHSNFFTPVIKKTFVRFWSTVKGTLVEEPSIYSSVSRLPFEWFSSNCAPRPFRTYAAKVVSMSWLVSIYRHFTWGTEYVFCCPSEYIKGFLVKTHTSQNPSVCYKFSKFGSYRSLINGRLLGLYCIVPFLLYLGFQWRDLPENPYLSPTAHSLEAVQVCLWPDSK